MTAYQIGSTDCEHCPFDNTRNPFINTDPKWYDYNCGFGDKFCDMIANTDPVVWKKKQENYELMRAELKDGQLFLID